MTSFQPVNAASLPPRSRSREWLGLALVIALPVSLLVAAAASINHYLNQDWEEASAAADQELNEAIAEADRLDPGWRLDELMARRKNLSDEDNSAVRVVAAQKLLPTPWPARTGQGTDGLFIARGSGKEPALDEILRDLPQNVQLDAEQIKQLRKDLSAAGDALAEARRIADQPEGRYALLLKPDYVSTLFTTQQHARSIVHLLKLDVTLLAQERKADPALDSVRAMLNVGRSLGDEPLLISQYIRLACRTEAIYALERVLAQSEPSENALAAVQQILTEEDAFPTLLIAARGERACLHMLMENLESGKVKTQELLPGLISSQHGHDTKQPEISLDAPALKSTHAWILRWMNEFVEVAKLPPWQREPRLGNLEKSVKNDAPPLARLLIPAVSKVADADQRNQALIRCAVAAVAAERYRKENGFWPRALAELEGKQLVRVPLDPCDGQPLRYRPPPLFGFTRGPTEVVVSSIGPVGQNDGRKLYRASPNQRSIDIKLHVWNVSARHKLPPS